jgi:hypothetical protein
MGYVAALYTEFVNYKFDHHPSADEVRRRAIADFCQVQDWCVVSAGGELVQHWQNRESEEILKAERNTIRGLNLSELA